MESSFYFYGANNANLQKNIHNYKLSDEPNAGGNAFHVGENIRPPKNISSGQHYQAFIDKTKKKPFGQEKKHFAIYVANPVLFVTLKSYHTTSKKHPSTANLVTDPNIC